MVYTVYPNAIDSTEQLPVTVDNQTPVKAEVVNRQRDAILAVESELGIQPSGTYTTVRARLDAIDVQIATLSERVTILENGGFLRVQQNGVTIVPSTNFLNFTGSNVTVTSGSNNTANIAITGGGGGAGTLAATLALGNITGGNNIIMSSGDTINSVTGTITLSGLARSTGIIGVEQGSRPFNPTGTGTGLVWVDGSTSPNRLIFSDDTGADHVLGTGGGETLAQTLVFGNTTGGTSIVMSVGDQINSASGTITMGGLARATALIAPEQSSRPFSPSGTNTGLIWVNNTVPNQLVFTDDSNTDHILSVAETLAATLAVGNTTSGTSIIMSSGDQINSATGTITFGGLTSATGMIASEQSSRPFNTTGTNTGLLWVNNAVPNQLVFSDDAGVDHILSAHINGPQVFVGVAGRENTNVVAPDDDGKGAIPFNPTEFDGYSSFTYKFQAVLETTSLILPAEIYLYNVTDGVVVPTFLSVPLTTSSVVPTLLERSLTLGTDIPRAAKVYEVMLRFASGTPGPSDRVTCRNAQIKVSN